MEDKHLACPMQSQHPNVLFMAWLNHDGGNVLVSAFVPGASNANTNTLPSELSRKQRDKRLISTQDKHRPPRSLHMSS